MNVCVAAIVCLMVPVAAFGQDSVDVRADTAILPRIRVEWPTAGGQPVRLEGERSYRSAADKSDLGKNIECYAALGGARLERGLGDPRGVTVRVGLLKKDPRRLFFEDVADGGEVTVTIDHVRMTRPVEPRPKTVLLQQRYALSDLASCGLDGNARNLFVTSDADDPLCAKVRPDSLRAGGLDGGSGHGRATAKVEADGSITITVSFPYEILRHVRDPNLRTKPGAFFEPETLHIEMELVAPVPAAEPARREGDR